MRVLFISPVLPHARVISGSIIVHNRIKLLAERGYEVGLATFLSALDEPFVGDLAPMLFEKEFVPTPPCGPACARFVRNLLCGLPPPFCDFRSEAMRRLLGAMVERSHYDVVVAEFSVMGQYLYRNPYLPAVRRIVSCHSSLTGAAVKAIGLKRWSWQSLKKRLMLRALQRYEFAMYRSADMILALTQQERLSLLRYEPNLRTAVVPYGVDVDHYSPSPEPQSEESLVFTGVYSDEANRDAVTWFARTVWPVVRDRHPNLVFYAIGSRPSHDMKDLARHDRRIVITGEVEDVAPHLAKARIYVCPMRMGTGFRGKILQAMASGVPVVSTTWAAEGIPAETGENIILADTPHVMTEAIELLLSDAALRQSIAANARDLVVRRFSWPRCVDLMENALRETVK